MSERNVKEGQKRKTKRGRGPTGLLRVTNLLTIVVFYPRIKPVTVVIYAPSSWGVARLNAFTEKKTSPWGPANQGRSENNMPAIWIPSTIAPCHTLPPPPAFWTEQTKGCPQFPPELLPLNANEGRGRLRFEVLLSARRDPGTPPVGFSTPTCNIPGACLITDDVGDLFII